MLWTAGTLLKQTREGTWTYRIRAVYANQVYLGKGGCGITYLADCLEGEHQKKRVVIKTILDEHYDRPDFLQIKNDFWAEAFRLRGCIHSHIVQVWDLFQEPIVIPTIQTRASVGFLERLVGSTQNTTMTLEVPCMVQEYIQGESLYDRLWRKKTALPEPEALKYIQQIGSALTVVHRQNMVHRDVKPENIMLRQPEYEAVLIDFGLVRPINIKRHTAFRSDGYAPPEQYLDETDRDATLDVYALAATLYVLVTGLDPVGDTRLVESKLRGSEQHMGRPDPLKRPEYCNPGISSQVSNAIWQGLKLLPGERPPTIAAWLGLMGLSLENDRSPVQPSSSTPAPIGVAPAPAIVNPPRTQKTVSAYARLKAQRQQVTFLGLPVVPYRYTTARVSATGQVTPYKANSPAGKYTETALKLPAGAVPLEMVAIPGGTFLMGSPESEANRFDSESPQHPVTVPGFLMGRYTVTQAQWFAVMGSDYNANGWQEKWRSLDSNFKKDQNQPIVYVSWDDAQAFIQRLNRLTGKTYRLPTEAEWEYAARAGTTTPFSYGETITPEVVNYDGNNPYCGAPKGEYRQRTIAVDSLYPNPWGLYHIHGNVWEWCADQWYDSYSNKPDQLKKDGSIAWTQANTNVPPSNADFHLLRGGSWYFNAWLTRSAIRFWRYVRNLDFGFRVLLSSRLP